MDIGAYGFIYITENLVNGKKYIGQKSFDIAGKWKKYLGSGVYLRRALKKYGKDSFSRKIIDVSFSPVILNEKEKYWIEYYNAVASDEFYNIACGGDGGNTVAGYSEEEYARFRKKQANAVIKSCKEHCGEKSSNAKLCNKDVMEIITRLMSGEFHTDIAKSYGLSVCTINDIANHKTWKFLTEGVEFPKITRQSVGDRSALSSSKQVAAYNKNDHSFVGLYKSMHDAGRELGVGYKMISQVCNGDRKSAHGYIFKFVN